ncbi:MAG: glucoamylase family protein [Fimbriimonadaceae bacterium]
MATLLTAVSLAAAMASTPVTITPELDDLSRRAVMFFWRESHPETGFTKDRAANFRLSDEFTVSSCASTGFALASHPIGVERGWLPRRPALERARLTLRNLLDRHSHERGWFQHWVHWATGEREWKGEFSTIDTAILLSGVIVARQYWRDPEVTRLADAILDRVDWEWMLTQGGQKPDQVLMTHGWYPETGFIQNLWANYSEELMLYILMYGFSDVSNAGWDKIARNVFTYNGIEFITGGPLFIHHMSHVFYDFSNRRDRLGFNYWVATRNATLANRAYAIDNPKGFKGYGPNFWGLSASDGPDGYSAFGAPAWINDNGTINPSSTIASLMWTPEESKQFLAHMLAEYRHTYGRYGFANGVNPTRNWHTPDVIGIELGMMLLSIENARDGLIHRLTMSHPAVQRGFDRAGLRPAPNSDRGPLRVAPRSSR